MNNICEIYNKDNQSNYLKHIKNTYMSNNIYSNYFSNMKTNNNNRNNYIYFSNNSHQIINNAQQNYLYFVDTEEFDRLSKKIKDKQNQLNQINISKNEKIKNNKKASFDCSKDNNIKNINLLEESNKKNIPKALSNDQKNKNVLDSLSEVKKFKTELCHSWELTGTCKYGENVNIKYIIKNNIL